MPAWLAAFHDLPKDLRSHAIAPYFAGLVDRTEHPAFSDSSSRSPGVNGGSDPCRDRNRSDVTSLSYQIRDDPALFSKLDGIQRQRQKFATP